MSTEPRKCKNCGGPIHPIRYKSAKFCTSACREAYNNGKQRDIRLGAKRRVAR